MKLTIGQIHEAVVGFTALENPEIKLSGEVILSIAININRLRILSTSYEQARARVISAILEDGQKNKKSNQELEVEVMEKDLALRNAIEEVDLRIIRLSDLNLSENAAKVRPITLSRLLPILTDVE